jgi:hypothetical protein
MARNIRAARPGAIQPLALAHIGRSGHFGRMIRRLTTTACFIAGVALAGGAHAGLRDDVARCARITDDGARLACFDAIVPTEGSDTSAALDESQRRELEAALQREFRFDPGLRTDRFAFRIAVSGDLQISRDTAAAREVERLVRRIGKAFGDFDGWSVVVTVHGAQVAFSRGKPYTGEELAKQAETGLKRTDLGADRYTVEVGPPAQPLLWDDGRVRSANEYIDVVIAGLE